MTPKYGIILKLLRQTANTAADQALGAALLAEEGDLVPQLAAVLLDRNSDQAAAGLIRSAHKLDKPQRQRLVNMCPKISGTLRTVSYDSDPRSRGNVLDLIRVTNHPKLAYILSYMLRDEVPVLRTRAAGIFKTMALRLVCPPSPGPAENTVTKPRAPDAEGPGELDAFFSVLETVLESFPNHLRTEVVEAAMYFGPMLPDRLWNVFTEERSRVGKAAVEILQRVSNPQFAGFAFRALTSPTLGKDVIRIISGYNREHFLRWLDYSWYRFDVTVRRNLARIAKPFRWLSGGVQSLLDLPAESQIRLVDVLMLTSIGTTEKLDILAALLAAPDPVVQEHVVSSLISSDLPGASNVLSRIVGIEKTSRFSARAARMARRHLLHLDPQAPGLAESAGSMSPDGAAPGIEQHFDQFWLAFEQLDGVTCQAAIERLSRLEENFVDRLREKMVSADPTERTRAVSVARRARVVTQLADEILTRCNDIHPATRSAAVGALSDLHGPAAEQKLVEALDDEDSRVQANAIEALEALGVPNLEEQIESKLDSPNNRIRANAIKAILKPRYMVAIRALSAMLDHPDPAFRRSALWAVMKTTPLNLGAKVVKLAKVDPDNHVRGMARKAVEALLSFWKESKPSAETAVEARGSAS